ncbi:unnamed protein product [Boreogadus saida]
MLGLSWGYGGGGEVGTKGAKVECRGAEMLAASLLVSLGCLLYPKSCLLFVSGQRVLDRPTTGGCRGLLEKTAHGGM